MSLQSLLKISSDKDVIVKGASEERVRACLPELRRAIAYYRAYPDIFVDDIKGPDCIFKFYTYQRVFLRAVMRHKWTYCTFPRAYSKSFLTMMSLMLKAILYPGIQAAVTTGGKEQAASITMAKIDEICKLIPALSNEINWARGQSKKGKDSVKYIFKNGSSIDILAARESSRGQRRNCIVIEEAILVDGDALNEIIIPTTNVDRLLGDGSKHPEEVVNKSQTFITTAGWKGTFPYERLIDMLVASVIDPKHYMILGGTFETPVKEGLLDEDFVDKLKLEGTFNDSSFDREYRSIWSGDAENAYFSGEVFDKHRQLLQPELEYSNRTSKNGFYVLGVDVGRTNCTTEVCVFKVTPQPQGASLKTLVNIYSYDAEDFEMQAIHVKKLFFKYKCRAAAIDANGLGIGFVDFMLKTQFDPDTGEELPPFGVDNTDTYEEYKKYNKQINLVRDAMFLIKANAPINTEIYAYVQTQMSSGKIKTLIDEREAGVKLMLTKAGQKMTPEQRADYLMPFTQTSILKEQMLNLIQENDGTNIILKQNNKSIKKDKFSAFGYGLYYIKLWEDSKKRKHNMNLADLMFFG
jgi:hypothetical protein